MEIDGTSYSSWNRWYRGENKCITKTDLEALEAIVHRREVNGRAFMVIGEAIGQILAERLDDHPKVVIGWDRRQGMQCWSGLTDGLPLPLYE